MITGIDGSKCSFIFEISQKEKPTFFTDFTYVLVLLWAKTAKIYLPLPLN